MRVMLLVILRYVVFLTKLISFGVMKKYQLYDLCAINDAVEINYAILY